MLHDLPRDLPQELIMLQHSDMIANMKNSPFLKSVSVVAILFFNSITIHAMPRMQSVFGEPIRVRVVLTQPVANSEALSVVSARMSTNKRLQTGEVVLMNVPLTSEARRLFATFQSYSVPAMAMATAFDATSESALPKRVSLGMNDVPVLDQGPHGACVTFAATGALDALLNQGDYVSQLCSLELGKYLESRSYLPSGWEGSWGSYVLARLSEYGMVSLAQQKAHTCAGVSDYPLNSEDNTGNSMSLDEYASLSEDFNNHFSWYSLLLPEMRFAPAWETAHVDDQLLNRVKGLLAAKDAKQSVRLIFGTLLPVEHCSAGACATYHQTDDTWALTDAIKRDEHPQYGGHEMIMTGYDDRAVAVDNVGSKHRGLLFLRNSWGAQYGDHGDFYMTYDFFKHYVMNVEVLMRP